MACAGDVCGSGRGVFGCFCEQALHGAVDGFVGLCGGGYVDECYVGACAFGHGEFGVSQAECLADAASHEHAVDCVAQAALGHYDDECKGGVAAP